MIFFAAEMFSKDAKINAPGFLAVLGRIRAKLESHIKENPLILEGLTKLIRSDSEFAAHPEATQLLKFLDHLVAALKIMDDIKGESEECSLCEGVGKFIHGSGMPCPRCGGSGKLNKKETYN